MLIRAVFGTGCRPLRTGTSKHFSQSFSRRALAGRNPSVVAPLGHGVKARQWCAEMVRAVSGQRPVVLVVEDEVLVRMNALDMIESAGFEVIAASNADDAICILESRSDIRAVFTDVNMPGTMDGLKLAGVVRNRWPPVALIVTSGLATVLETDLPIGGRFLPKPYQSAQLTSVLRQLLA